MHELSIAISILDIVSEEQERLGETPCAVHIKVGPLSGVVPAALISAFQLATEGTPLEGLELIIDEVPVIAWCNHCDCERPVISIQEFTCEQCGEPISRIISGQELEVTGLEVPA